MLEVRILSTLARLSIFSNLFIPLCEEILDIIEELVMNLNKGPGLFEPDEPWKVK
jgi:hypothetical protein